MPKDTKRKASPTAVHEAAVALGRLAGLRRSQTMTAVQRSEQGRMAVAVRWTKAKRLSAPGDERGRP